MPIDVRKAHWETVYAARDPDELSWYLAWPSTLLELIGNVGLGPEASLIDVGGGASRLVDALLEAGYRDLAVLDISEEALARSRARLEERAERVSWVAADISRWTPPRTFDIWHDRAVFHFLTDPADRAGYRAAITSALAPGGQAIIGTFALDGPARCSGLPVVRYSPETLAAELGTGFRLLDSAQEDHLTPSGAVQRFQFSRLERLP